VAIVRDSLSGTRRPFGDWDRGGSGEIALSDAHKKTLLAFARKTIEQYLTTETAPLPRGFDAMLTHGSGAFVTLTEQGQLRGCIGHMDEDLPLCQTVGYCALQAALNDPRFPPVGLKEWPRVSIEISVLTPLKPVGGYGDILIGRDGVVIEKDGRSAVFLPQVATEQGWDRDQMLEHLCTKAGLPPGSWRQGASFRTFQAIVFSESDSH
jgi:AmmeMemoRadiSam system protein A